MALILFVSILCFHWLPLFLVSITILSFAINVGSHPTLFLSTPGGNIPHFVWMLATPSCFYLNIFLLSFLLLVVTCIAHVNSPMVIKTSSSWIRRGVVFANFPLLCVNYFLVLNLFHFFLFVFFFSFLRSLLSETTFCSGIGVVYTRIVVKLYVWLYILLHRYCFYRQMLL